MNIKNIIFPVILMAVSLSVSAFVNPTPNTHFVNAPNISMTPTNLVSSKGIPLVDINFYNHAWVTVGIEGNLLGNGYTYNGPILLGEGSTNWYVPLGSNICISEGHSGWDLLYILPVSGQKYNNYVNNLTSYGIERSVFFNSYSAHKNLPSMHEYYEHPGGWADDVRACGLR